MKILKGKSDMKALLLGLAILPTLLFLAACGGGGGSTQTAATAAKTTAILTINLTGTLPTNTGIAGTTFTVTLPADVTPALTSGVVADGVVTPSGTFAGGTPTSPVYIPATASAPGTLNVALANAAVAGVTQVGEVATITLQLANGATPTAASFGVSAVNVIDAAVYGMISGMGANIASVTLQ